MTRLAAICAYCDVLVESDDAHAHFGDLHPGMEWSFLRWPEDEPAYLDLDAEVPT